MSCFGCFRSQKRAPKEIDSLDDHAPRPARSASYGNHSGSGSGTDEKARIPLGGLPRAPAAVHPNVNPRYSAYAAPAGYNPQQSSQQHAWAAAPQSGHESQWKDKDMGVDDPEGAARRARMEAARRKAEQQEQEDRDFLQML